MPLNQGSRLSGILLRNFRAYEKEAFFAIRGLTLVFGSNSAGKSTPLLALNLLKNSLEERNGYLNTSGSRLNIGGARSLPHKRNPDADSEVAVYLRGLAIDDPDRGMIPAAPSHPDIYSEYVDDNNYDFGIGVVFGIPGQTNLNSKLANTDGRARIKALRVYVGQSTQPLAEFKLSLGSERRMHNIWLRDSVPLRCQSVDAEHPLWAAAATRWGALLCTLVAANGFTGRTERAEANIGLYDHVQAEERYPALNAFDSELQAKLKENELDVLTAEEFDSAMMQHFSLAARRNKQQSPLSRYLDFANTVTLPEQVAEELARSIAFSQRATIVGINSWSPDRDHLIREELKGHPLMEAWPGAFVPSLNLAQMLKSSATAFRTIVRDVHVVTAERDSIGRISLFSRSEQPDSVGSLLSTTAFDESREWNSLEDALKVSGIGFGIHIERWSNPNDLETGAFAVKVREEGMPGTMNIVDHGLGLQKVLPVLVSSLIELHKAIAIQEPESHLHPEMQKSIATFLAIASQKRIGPVFVETHSEHILRRVLAMVGHDSISIPKLQIANIALLYVSRVNGASSVTELEIAPNGTLITPWPNDSANDGYRELLT